MIKNLRKRFIFAAMASTFGVLFVIMSILNVANYVRMVSRADDTLDELADNNGQFDSRDFMKELMPDHKDGQLPSNSGESDGNAVTKQDESETYSHLKSLVRSRVTNSHRKHRFRPDIFQWLCWMELWFLTVSII